MKLYRVYIMEGNGVYSNPLATWDRFGSDRRQVIRTTVKAANAEWPDKAGALWFDAIEIPREA